MVEALTKFHGLLRGNSTIDSSLDLFDGSLATAIDERGNVEFFSRMFEHVTGDGHCRLPEDIAEYVIQLEVGNGETVLRAILFTSLHVRELPQITDEVTQMADSWWRNEARLDHVAHEQVANPLGVLAVGLVPLLRLGVLRMGERDSVVGFEDVEHWNPILTGRFHANFVTGVQRQPIVQFLEPFWETRETSLYVLCTTVRIRDADAAIDPGFVDIEPTTVLTMNLEHDVPPANRFAELAGTGCPAKLSQLRKR